MQVHPINPRRNKAVLVDTIVYMAIIILPVLCVEVFPTRIGGRSIPIGVALSLLYVVFRDGFNGQSVGKRVFKIQVVYAETRKPIGFRMAFLRGFLTALPILGWFDFILTVFTENQQRLSDKLIGTLVIATDEPVSNAVSRDTSLSLANRRQRISNGTIYFFVAVGIVVLNWANPFSIHFRETPQVHKRRANAERMKTFVRNLEGFQHICGHFPTTAQGVSALITDLSKSNCATPNTAALLEHLPVDEWGQPFRYVSDGKIFTLEAIGELEADPKGQLIRFESGWTEPKVIGWLSADGK